MKDGTSLAWLGVAVLAGAVGFVLGSLSAPPPQAGDDWRPLLSDLHDSVRELTETLRHRNELPSAAGVPAGPGESQPFAADALAPARDRLTPALERLASALEKLPQQLARPTADQSVEGPQLSRLRAAKPVPDWLSLDGLAAMERAEANSATIEMLQSTFQDVITRFGTPTAMWRHRDSGTIHWAYNQEPPPGQEDGLDVTFLFEHGKVVHLWIDDPLAED